MVDERHLVYARSVGNNRLVGRRDARRVGGGGRRGDGAGGVVRHRAVRERLSVADGGPLVLEAVLQVIADIVELRQNRLVLPHRILAGEGISVAVGLKAVQADRRERRLPVVYRDVEHLGGVVAREAEVRVVVPLRAEHDGERVVLARVILRKSVEDGERAVDIRADRAYLASDRGRHGDVGIGQYRLRGSSAEKRKVYFFVAEEERVDRLACVVLGAELHAEAHHVAFDVVVRIGVEGRCARRLRGRDPDWELDGLARLLADRRSHLDLASDVARRRELDRRREVVGEANELAALAARLELVRQRLPAGADVVHHRIANVGIGHVGIRVGDGDNHLLAFACRWRVGGRRVVWLGNDGLRRADPKACVLVVAGDAGCGLVRWVDGRREQDLVGGADGVVVATQRIDVDRLLLGRADVERIRVFIRARQRSDFIHLGKAHVVPPVRHGGLILERWLYRDLHGVRDGLGEIEGDARLGRVMVAVGHDRLIGALDHDARRQRLDALHRDSHVVDDTRAGRRRVVELRIRAHDERRRLALGASLRLDEEWHRVAGATLERDHRDVEGVGDANCANPHRDRRNRHGARRLDLDLVLVLGPHVERPRALGRRTNRKARADAAASDCGVLVDGAPEGGVLGVVGEVDSLDEYAAFLKRVVCRRRTVDVAVCTRRAGAVGSEYPCAVLLNVAVCIEAVHLPVRRQRVEGILAVFVHLVAGGAVDGGKANWHREVAGLRRVLEDKRRRVGAFRLRRDEVGVRLHAGDVDAYPHRVQRLGDVLGQDAVVRELPAVDRGARDVSRDKAYLEVYVYARAKRVRVR